MINETEEPGLRPCAFIINADYSDGLLAGIGEFFFTRMIPLDLFQLQQQGNFASVIIHCRIARDKITYTVTLLKKLHGIINLECMEARGRYQL